VLISVIGVICGKVWILVQSHYCFLNLSSYSAPSTELVRIR
jgi:hypothetical protein